MVLAIAGFAAPAVVALTVIFAFRVLPLEGRNARPERRHDGRQLDDRNGRRSTPLVEEVRDKRDEVEARLALGQPSGQVATPYLRAALRSAASPQIETTKATGLVFLPGATTGLILAGVAPTQAVLVQAVVLSGSAPA